MNTVHHQAETPTNPVFLLRVGGSTYAACGRDERQAVDALRMALLRTGDVVDDPDARLAALLPRLDRSAAMLRTLVFAVMTDVAGDRRDSSADLSEFERLLTAKEFIRAATDAKSSVRRELRESMQVLLRSLGWVDSHPFERQPPSFFQQYGYAQAYLTEILRTPMLVEGLVDQGAVLRVRDVIAPPKDGGTFVP